MNVKILISMIIILSTLSEARSQPYKGNSIFCENELDYKDCVKTFEGLPPISLPPKLGDVVPIKIKVIPYKQRNKRRYNSWSGTKWESGGENWEDLIEELDN